MKIKDQKELAELAAGVFSFDSVSCHFVRIGDETEIIWYDDILYYTGEYDVLLTFPTDKERKMLCRKDAPVEEAWVKSLFRFLKNSSKAYYKDQSVKEERARLKKNLCTTLFDD